MSKQLYEEAIADAKHIKSIAEDNAKRAVIAAVESQIRDLIERHLMEGSGDLGDDADADNILTDVAPAAGAAADGAAAITPPGPDGKVTLDLDALSDCAAASTPGDGSRPAGDLDTPGAPGEDFILNAESVAALEPIISGGMFAENDIELQTYRLGEAIAQFTRAGRAVRASRGFAAKIDEMISRVKNTYECVQESVKDSTKRRSLERKLEAFNRALGRLTESQMSNRRSSKINEGDVTLKLTGLPDELDLDSVGVDLIKDDEDDDGGGDGGGELDLDGGGDDGDGGDLDLSGGDDGGEKKMGEGRRLSDDTVVEIDEGMLRREISRMRTLREEAVPSTKGHAPKGSELDDFGDGADEGDPWLDSDVPKGGTSIKVVGEGDEVLEIDMGEGEEPPVAECDTPMNTRDAMGEARSRIRRERRFQEGLTRRMASLQSAGRRAKASGDARKLAEAASSFKTARRQLSESQGRINRLRERLAESAGNSRTGARSNSGPRQPAERGATFQDLRSKLVQSNLRNAKLIATTKLLQNESLTSRQRAEIVDQLETARSPREVKLVYESLTRTLVKNSRPLAEGQDRRVRGSASRATRPASTATLNESNEAARWAQLAGIH